MSEPSPKPLDLGTGSVCASFDPVSAAWLSIGAPHPVVGFAELSAVPAFDERDRGRPEATRRHRVAMTSGAHAFLAIVLDGSHPRLEPDLTHPARISWPGAEVTVSAEGAGISVRQRWSFRHPADVRLVLRGRLDRPALAEITELDPPEPTRAHTTRSIRAGRVRIEAAELPAACVVTTDPPVAWTDERDAIVGTLAWPAAAQSFELEIAVEAEFAIPRRDAPMAPGSGDPLTDRALSYVRGCTALAVTPDERAFLTDHRLLPLSWTRDAYWQALALLTVDGPDDRGRVADHLRWLWRRCERPDGRWVRSHHANGRRKDLAFQADQQLYPVLEMADFWRRHGELPAGVDWDAAVPQAWVAALEALDPTMHLIGCGENAADDPVEAPFIGASQIVLWYAALRLAELAEDGALALDARALRECAASVRDAFDAHVALGGAHWAYAVDVDGTRVDYHDANDLPIALAPVWGFCDASDAGWRATMDFAFSPQNAGWFPGDRPGLGSAHTPGPWTLGDIQTWLHARSIGDLGAAARARKRVDGVAFADGMLPEAYSPLTDDDWRVRHWFTWPGAALAALTLLDRDDVMEARLSAGPRR